ncbi:M1 family metallopeptidase [Aliikangiella marina]|uniref:Aminopeptidase N n=1 Tax=Aliikangiella marina TaxID=1712262 RepID=A0A545T710_9GAMM|nr:M1 family metallopeptidase [Aliikangiella marina]TQV73013.1 M1 family metallopeptidase [Aliikangiella marina]
MKTILKLAVSLCLFVASTSSIAASNQSSENKDWHTLSNYQQIISTHIHLNLEVDFNRKQLKGYVDHTIKKIDPSVTTLAVDTRALEIHKTEAMVDGQWKATPFEMAEPDAVRGTQLSVEVPAAATQIRIHYNSRPEASGLQWLTPEQTAGKKYPFMFSQSQAIHARSWIPIQDTPAMRVTYTATVKTDKAMRPVMSADNNPKRSPDGVYQFNMPQAIPPYLIAIAAGDILHKKMSKQTAIYSEQAYLDSAAKEFEDTQAMIEATEKLYGDYLWNQYDLLVLPPSFPFGGMENPRLSFITPTVIAGDKSLVNLIAHELAHSWSGNLVTNATWRDLWLNEGFTSYVENRIMEEVFGRDRAVMEQALAAQDLNHEMKTLPEADQILHVEMQGRDPDDAFSGIPYTKGQLFLIYLEEKFGRQRFDAFVKTYFETFAFKSLDTPSFVSYLHKNLIDKYPGVVSKAEINEWIFKPKLPKNAPQPKSNAFKLVQQHIDNWLASKSSLADIPTGKWTIHEWLYFVNNLPRDLSIERMAELDKAYNLTQSTNNEVAHAWLLLSIQREYDKVNNRLSDYLISIGRRKLIVPLYKALLENPDYLTYVSGIYRKARPGYHPLAQGTIDALFKEAKNK